MILIRDDHLFIHPFIFLFYFTITMKENGCLNRINTYAWTCVVICVLLLA